MMRRPIRNLSSNSSCPPRICDVVIDGDNVDLEFKHKDHIERIPLKEFNFQVDSAIDSYKQQLNA